jgi:hypothetical protein
LFPAKTQSRKESIISFWREAPVSLSMAPAAPKRTFFLLCGFASLRETNQPHRRHLRAKKGKASWCAWWFSSSQYRFDINCRFDAANPSRR